MLTTRSRDSPSRRRPRSFRETRRRAIRQACVTAPAPEGGPFKTAAVLFLVAMLQAKLSALLRALVRIGEAVVAEGLRSPLAAGTVWPELFRDAGEKDADSGEPLLPVHDPIGGHDAGSSRLRKGEQGAAIVGCVGVGCRDGQKVLDQSFDIGLPPTIPALPTRDDVLDLSVEELEEPDGLGMHGVFLFWQSVNRSGCR